MKFLLQVVLGLCLGILVGAVLGQEHAAFVDAWIAPFGKIFINVLKAMIVPLVLSSVIVGVSSLDDVAKLGRIGCKTFGLYMFTTLVAVCLGLGFAHFFEPGKGLSALLTRTDVNVAVAPAQSFAEVLMDIFPRNIIRAMYDDNMLQVIVIAVAVGVTLAVMGEKVALLNQVIKQFSEVCFKITGAIVKVTPMAVFALTVPVVVRSGIGIFLPLFKLTVVFYGAMFTHMCLTYGAMLVCSGLKPWRFFRNILPAFVMAMSVRSSGVTLPVTTDCCKKMGISDSMTSFVLPFGSVVNMDGTAIYEGVCALFVAQVYGIDLGLSQYMMIVLISTLASVGNATIPSGSFVMLAMVLTSVGLPLEGMGLVAGIDVVLDMFRTALNVTGDAVVCGTVAISEGEVLEV